MARCTREQSLETRSRILDAAELVFHARGVSRPSLSEIAEFAGVTRGAIYYHFKNKSDVFTAMCKRVKLPLEALYDLRMAGSQDDPLGSFREVCAFVFRQTVTDPRLRRVFEIIFHKCEIVSENAAIFERQLESHHSGLGRIREYIGAAAQRGQLPADLDLDLASNAFHAAIGGVLRHWLFFPDAFDLDRQAERLADALVDTLRFSPALRKGYLPHGRCCINRI